MTDTPTRRAFLRRAGVAGSLAALAGCGGQPSETTPDVPQSERPDIPRGVPVGVRRLADRWSFDSVVTPSPTDVDASGARVVDDALERAAADGALLFLGAGRYRLTQGFPFAGFERFGLVGRNATLVPADGFDQTLLELGYSGESGELLIEGLDFDFRAENTGGRPFVARAANRLVVRDVTVTGRQDVNNDMVRIDLTDPGGQALVERLRLPDGGVPGSFDGDSGITGCEVGSDTRGDLSFVDCHIEGFPDNGLYADPPEGSVQVLGGYYANNGVANVRVNGGPGSVVRGVHVRCDEAREGVENMRGIRLRGGDNPVVEDCLIELETVTGSDGAVTVHSELAAATVRNCRVRVDADGVSAIRVKSPDSGVSADGEINIQNVVIRGRGRGSAAMDISDRRNVTVEGSCIHQTGRARDGIRASAVNGRVANSLIAVRGRPLAFERSNLETVDLTTTRSPRQLSNVRHESCRQS